MSKHILYKLLIKSAFFTVGMLLVWIILNQLLSPHFWDGMTTSKSAITGEYCEFNNVNKFFHQPMNTYSNLSYFFFGVLIILIGKEDYKNKNKKSLNRMEQFPLLSVLLGIYFIYLCFGSAFFHASLTFTGQRVDMNGTYGVSITLLSIGIYHVFHKIHLSDTAKYLWVGALVLFILVFFKIALLVSSSVLLPAMILLLTLINVVNYFQFRTERSIILAILSFLLIIVAIKIRALDVQKKGCDPHSLYQGHALWHFLTALSSFYSYAFFRFGKSIRINK
ncbi:ceramidase domain-containing protein [Emticicia soli]|uniref:Ceramidase domain-containing protein n=1 Tax=Emticicia soli TaxID=2027878 RepID=A0ABW5J304_9BACT